jgi:UDP-N-acetylglucosamine 2-epimerase (non-hydrolysing)
MKTVVTITGIRPDFIRMSEIFKKLDDNFNHILIHTGQHYDALLSDVFFNELEIRKPDYNLEIGGRGKEHFHQSADLSVKIIELLRKEDIKPDIILFLGDSNSAMAATPLKKEGYKIGHIEAGMRSYDKRMLEEINRVCCDHCSDLLFVYHDDYKNNLLKENFDSKSIHVVGNTIVEVAMKFNDLLNTKSKTKDFILLDIHRPENFKHRSRLENIIKYAQYFSNLTGLPIKLLGFKRTMDYITEFKIDLTSIDCIELMSYKDFMLTQYNAAFMISDSGTAQEEPALLRTPVLVPRDYTERPQSYANNCSHYLDVNEFKIETLKLANDWLKSISDGNLIMKSDWLGDGKTSTDIITILKHSI